MKNKPAPTQQDREKLQRRILNALQKEIRNLRKPMQRMLADDLVTAFENRIAVIQTAQQKISQKRG